MLSSLALGLRNGRTGQRPFPVAIRHATDHLLAAKRLDVSRRARCGNQVRTAGLAHEHSQDRFYVLMEVIGFQARRSREGSSFSSQQVRITGRTFRGSDVALWIIRFT